MWSRARWVFSMLLFSWAPPTPDTIKKDDEDEAGYTNTEEEYQKEDGSSFKGMLSDWQKAEPLGLRLSKCCYTLVATMTATQMAAGILINASRYRLEGVGAQAKAALTYMIMNKAFLAPPSSSAINVPRNPNNRNEGAQEHTWNSGTVFNLASVEASRIEDCISGINAIWTVPASFLLAIPMLATNVDASSLGGLLILLLGLPLFTRVSLRIWNEQKALTSMTSLILYETLHEGVPDSAKAFSSFALFLALKPHVNRAAQAAVQLQDLLVGCRAIEMWLETDEPHEMGTTSAEWAVDVAQNTVLSWPARSSANDFHLSFNTQIQTMNDPSTSKAVFEDGLCGLAKDRTRFVATNQAWVASQCDRILWLEEGKATWLTSSSKLEDYFPSLMEEESLENSSTQQPQAQSSPPLAAMKASTPDFRSTSGSLPSHEDAKRRDSFQFYLGPSGGPKAAVIAGGIVFLWQVTAAAVVLWLSLWTSDRFGLSGFASVTIFAILGFGEALLAYVRGNYYVRNECLQVFPQLLLVVLPGLSAVIAMMHRYAPRLKTVRCREAELRARVNAAFSESVDGSSSISVYKVDYSARSLLVQRLNGWSNVRLLAAANLRWLEVRLDAIEATTIGLTGALVVASSASLSPSTVGLIMSQALVLPASL
ncbi:oligomycin resistance atp-dependent permease [Colletotrichum kahawae]|uniref:Oligomycin resistance atp-dependent permease n=1 Tax=Colletotrichum kahawae TaxID=34407 RepID=A0AAD9YGK6_COLKA|nr:oligomycin resistance atp-dependent permease [Colletotrichum kahawae]